MKNLLLAALAVSVFASCEKEDMSNINSFKAEVNDSVLKVQGKEIAFPKGSVSNWGSDNYPFVEAKAVSGSSIISVNGESFNLNDSTFTVIYRR